MTTTVALVTGGGSGLGAATARTLAGAGLHVVILDLPGSPGAEVAREIGGSFRPGDVTAEADVRAAVELGDRFGDLRVAVCCAGIATPGRILGRDGTLPLESFRWVVEVNLVGTFAVLRAAAERMSANDPQDEAGPTADRGVIVMTSSVAAYDGQVGQAAYAASKAGVAGLTLAAARDLAGRRIRVMAVAPGTFETPLMAGLGKDVRAALEAQTPHPARLGQPEEYASLVRHIITNQMLNGEVIRLDGALRMPPR